MTSSFRFRTTRCGGHDVRVPEQPASFSTMARGRSVVAPELDEHGTAIRAWLDKRNPA
jgi:hypothetical protein